MLTDTTRSPYAKVHALDGMKVKWTGGLWKERFDTCANSTVPQLKHMFDSKDISHVVENFKICAGDAQGDFDGTVFGDGDFYKWMESAIYTAYQLIIRVNLTQDTYEALRTTSREGINQTPESIQKLDILLSPLLKKGQSIAHIYASHADEIACSRRTIYSYIDRGVFQARNIDLRRKVVYKQRKRKTTTSLKDRSFRKGRGYKEFLEYIAANKSVYVVEMDTVEGAKGTSPCFLTMFFRNCSLMLMFLLEEQTQKEVTRIFDHLTELLGIELFQKLFEVILTDNGHEFQDRQSLEYSKNDEVRTRIYYCDPNRSDQKGALEKNHEYIRYVLPKGTSFEKMTDKTTLLLLNHINSEKRDSLNGHSPYEVSRLLLDNRLHKALGLAEIPADEVTLIPALIK